MLVYAPDYYKDFKCIAHKCNHNCCIGWEIDVDDNTYEYYKSIKGNFAKKILNNISSADEGHYFLLDGAGKCPFLNDDGLCEIIINLGENALCQICADHPRFRNFFGSREEVGLGLCCEAVTALVAKKESKTQIIKISSDDFDDEIDDVENEFFIYRQKLIDILQNRDKNFEYRVYELLNYTEVTYPLKNNLKWPDVFLSLEYMGNDLKDMITKLKEIEISLNLTQFDICFEQISV